MGSDIVTSSRFTGIVPILFSSCITLSPPLLFPNPQTPPSFSRRDFRRFRNQKVRHRTNTRYHTFFDITYSPCDTSLHQRRTKSVSGFLRSANPAAEDTETVCRRCKRFRHPRFSRICLSCKRNHRCSSGVISAARAFSHS